MPRYTGRGITTWHIAEGIKHMSPHFTRTSKAKNTCQRWGHWFAERQREWGLCPYCGVQMVPSADCDDRNSESQDHIVPQSRGGRITVLVCRGCNQDKHHLTLNEYRLVLSLRHQRVHLFYFERMLPRLLLNLLWFEFFPYLCFAR